MTGMEERETILKRDVLLLATAGLSLINGMAFSPLMGPGLPIGPVGALLRPFIAGTFLASPLLFNYLTSLFCSIMTLLIAGVPAALYERFKGERESTPFALGIWLTGTLLLTFPALMNMAAR